MAAAVDWLAVGGPVEPWLGLGLVSTAVDEDGCRAIPLFGTGIEVDIAARPGLRRLVVSGVDRQLTAIDGIPVEVRGEATPMFAAHPCGARSVDHVVDRHRRPRAHVRGRSPTRQVPRSNGCGRPARCARASTGSAGLIVEVVERAGLPPGPARCGASSSCVDDLARCLRPARVRTRSASARAAVQPGRSIATVTSEAGLGVPLALMSPDLR